MRLIFLSLAPVSLRGVPSPSEGSRAEAISSPLTCSPYDSSGRAGEDSEPVLSFSIAQELGFHTGVLRLYYRSAGMLKSAP
jgi:hypothetical protein